MNRRSFLSALAVAAACPACASLGATPARADSAHWSYEGASGPAKWSGVCATGRQQSPLDIVEPVKAALPKLSFDYRPGVSEIVNNGHTIQVNVPPGSFMVSGGERHALVQFHFHRPSEHLIDGKASAMEVHYVHRTQAGGLAVDLLLGDHCRRHRFGSRSALLEGVLGTEGAGAQAERYGSADGRPGASGRIRETEAEVPPEIWRGHVAAF